MNIICFYAYNTLLYTHPPSLPYPLFSGDLGTLSLGIPYHTCNATKVARETTVFCFFFCVCFFFQNLCLRKMCPKIWNATTTCKFIKAALDSENNTYVESGGDPRFSVECHFSSEKCQEEPALQLANAEAVTENKSFHCFASRK